MKLERFARGLVVGKFSPLHLGHAFLIDEALKRCDTLYLLSYSVPELGSCSASMREAWLRELFPKANVLVLDAKRIAGACAEHGIALRSVPHNDDADEVHREFVGWVCTRLWQTTVDAVFTSEDYGDGFAASLARQFSASSGREERVRHICVDRARARHPVSGTLLRDDLHVHRAMMPPRVYADFVRRVCLLGGESSGKTTLAAAVARAMGTVWVPEYGRQRWLELNGRLSVDDLVHIARTQVAHEDAAARRANRWLVCDTSPLTTLQYCLADHGAAPPELEALSRRRYELVVVCEPDVDFDQDGTRRDAAFRRQQHEWTLATLDARGVSHVCVGGSVEERVAAITALMAAQPSSTA